MRSTAKQRVLAALQAGPQTTAALCAPSVGGERFGGRVYELRKDGHHILERRLRAGSSLYTLIQAVPDPGRVAVGPGPSTAPPAVGTVGGADRTDRKTIGGPWRRVWLCRECGYRERSTQRCPRGHDAVRGWSGDFTRPATERAEAA